MSQLENVLQGMGQALQGVVRLKLISLVEEGLAITPSTDMAETQPCTATLAHILPATVSEACNLLATALPKLNDLWMQGCCSTAAFEGVGRYCPELTHVQVEASMVPITALEKISQQLPNLTCFTVRSACTNPDGKPLGLYVDACLRALQTSSSLSTMELEFDKHVILKCQPGQWQQIPQTLKVLDCHSQVFCVAEAAGLLAGLHTLSLKTHTSVLDVSRILTAAPGLQHFSISCPALLMLHCSDDTQTLASISMLSKRLHEGLHFSVGQVVMWGHSTAVQAVMTSLPTLSDVRSCAIRCYKAFVDSMSLTHMARVFPNLGTLKMQGPNAEADGTELGLGLLAPLAGCVFLKQLSLHVHLRYNTSDLARLCLSMPGLKQLRYTSKSSVSLDSLESVLLAEGRVLDIQETCSS